MTEPLAPPGPVDVNAAPRGYDLESMRIAGVWYVLARLAGIVPTDAKVLLDADASAPSPPGCWTMREVAVLIAALWREWVAFQPLMAGVAPPVPSVEPDGRLMLG